MLPEVSLLVGLAVSGSSVGLTTSVSTQSCPTSQHTNTLTPRAAGCTSHEGDWDGQEKQQEIHRLQQGREMYLRDLHLRVSGV